MTDTGHPRPGEDRPLCGESPRPPGVEWFAALTPRTQASCCSPREFISGKQADWSQQGKRRRAAASRAQA